MNTDKQLAKLGFSIDMINAYEEVHYQGRKPEAPSWNVTVRRGDNSMVMHYMNPTKEPPSLSEIIYHLIDSGACGYADVEDWSGMYTHADQWDEEVIGFNPWIDGERERSWSEDAIDFEPLIAGVREEVKKILEDY